MCVLCAQDDTHWLQSSLQFCVRLKQLNLLFFHSFAHLPLEIGSLSSLTCLCIKAEGANVAGPEALFALPHTLSSLTGMQYCQMNAPPFTWLCVAVCW